MRKKQKLALLCMMGMLSACNFNTKQSSKVDEIPKKITIVAGKEIDVTKQNETIKIVQGNDENQKKKQIEAIINSPNDYNPPVLFALSRALYQQNEKEKATYWFYVAQLRARYDANLCTDESAKQAVQVLNDEYGSEINKYAFQDITKLKQTVDKVVAFVKGNEENYDHRWIYLHGMEAVEAGLTKTDITKEMTKSRSEWNAIKTKTIDNYYNGFLTYIKEN